MTKYPAVDMSKTDHDKRLKSSLKNTKAQLKRREDKIARLEAKVAQLEEEAKKKAPVHIMDQILRTIAKSSPDTNSRSSSSDTQSRSDAKQTAALEILSRLLKG